MKFKNPVVMVKTISKNFLWNAKEVFGDVEDGMKDWNTQEFRPAGKMFGQVLYVLTQ